MGGGHVRGQLALFFGLCQPEPSLTLSPASPGAASLQPPGCRARPALLVARGWDAAVPRHGVGHATASNAPAGWAYRMLQGQGCCVKTSICTLFSAAGQDPSLLTLAALAGIGAAGIGAGATPELASLPCHSTAGQEETATNPWRAGFLLAFIFTDA